MFKDITLKMQVFANPYKNDKFKWKRKPLQYFTKNSIEHFIFKKTLVFFITFYRKGLSWENEKTKSTKCNFKFTIAASWVYVFL